MHANYLITKNDQQAEVQYFGTEFNETFQKLKANVLEEANRKLWLNKQKREEMESYITQHRPIPDDIYTTRCFNGYQRQFPETMKLFNFALQIPLSMVSVERGFQRWIYWYLHYVLDWARKTSIVWCVCVWTGQKSCHTRQLRN